MAFTGKATYTSGSTLPETAEDVADLVGIASPFETPLLDALGDAPRAARSTLHEWLEDTLLPNTDKVNQSSFGNASTDTSFAVANSSRFVVGDQIQLAGSSEVMLVTGVDSPSAGAVTVVRGYGGSTATALSNNAVIDILGSAALEGDDAAAARFNSRARKTNYTQIFTATAQVSGSELAVRQIGVADELDYQKQSRTKELLRDLENCVINGRAPAANQQGSSTVRRTMNGILSLLSTNRIVPGSNGFPSSSQLDEEQLNLALRQIWQNSSGHIDLIVVNGQEKRSINNFVASVQRYQPSDEAFKQQISMYESDFGVCRVVMSRWVPVGTVLLLDSSRISVMPLAGRSFYYKPLAPTGDKDGGQIIGEYTLELRNENAHGAIVGYTA